MTGSPEHLLNPAARCPACLAVMDDFTQMTENAPPKVQPKDGDAAICAYCQTWLTWTLRSGILALRLPTPEENAEYRADPRMTTLTKGLAELDLDAKRSKTHGIEDLNGLDPEAQMFVCPECSAIIETKPYDIGSGPEVSCSHCETCFGANGQALDPLDPLRSFNKMLAEHPEKFSSWVKPFEIPTDA